MSSLGSVLRALSLLLTAGLALFAVATARAVLDGNRAMEESDAAFDRGDLRGAVLHARRAATLYAPGAPHVGRAYERLNAVALGSEAIGQTEVAFFAWQATRAAALESRHVVQPRAAELERANQNLARLEVALRGAKPEQQAELRKEALARFRSHESAPEPFWALALALGFGLALGGLTLFAVRGVARDGTVVVRNARLGALLALLGAACWTIAVLKA